MGMKCNTCPDVEMRLIESCIVKDKYDFGEPFLGADYTEWLCDICKHKGREIRMSFSERKDYKEPQYTTIPLKKYGRIPTYPVPLGNKKKDKKNV